MSPTTVSAQFAAYVWFGGQRHNARKSDADALRFARENWEAFLPLAQPGLGRLLLQIAGSTPSVAMRPTRVAREALSRALQGRRVRVKGTRPAIATSYALS